MSGGFDLRVVFCRSIIFLLDILMSLNKEVHPVLEDSKFKGVQHVSVDKTVALIGKELGEHDEVELLARQSEISRVGMIMKRVEE